MVQETTTNQVTSAAAVGRSAMLRAGETTEAFTRVCSVGSVAEAAMLQSLLESEGISCRLEDEHFASVAPHMAEAQGGIGVCVPVSNEEEAKAIVEKARASETGGIVFRVRGATPWLVISIPFFLAYAGPIFFLGMSRSLALLIGLFTLPFSLAFHRARLKKDGGHCSRPGCAHSLRIDEASCPQCHGIIRGEIARMADRLDAEERIRTQDDAAAA